MRMKTKTRTTVFSSLVYLFLALMGVTASCIVWAMHYDLPNLYHPAQAPVPCVAQPAPCCATKEK